LAALFIIGPVLFQMSVIVPSLGLTNFRPILLPIASSRGGHFVWISSLIEFFSGGHSVGMSGPVPGSGSPSLHPSSGFFVQDLREFVVVIVKVVVVALWVADWGSATVPASAVFLVGVSGDGGGAGGGVRGPIRAAIIQALHKPLTGQLWVMAWSPMVSHVGGSCCLGCLGCLFQSLSLLL